jgi:RNA polymerase sigma-70 factor (ECF subfamily)
VRTDAELVTSTIAGDPLAFAELVGRHERSMRATAFYILRDHHTAEDATQDAFVSAYKKLPVLRDRASFAFWVMKILRRRAVELLKRGRKTVSLECATNVAAPGVRPGLDDERLIAALMRLPKRERMVLMLRHFDGHEVRMIAAITGESVGTITKRISRGHARLRDWLKESFL